jgi:hypothetical protein
MLCISQNVKRILQYNSNAVNHYLSTMKMSHDVPIANFHPV